MFRQKKTENPISVAAKAHPGRDDTIFAILRRIETRLERVERLQGDNRRDINRIERGLRPDRAKALPPLVAPHLPIPQEEALAGGELNPLEKIWRV